MLNYERINKKIIAEGWNLELEYIPRNIVPVELIRNKSSLVLIGPRRAGKSYVMYEIMKQLGNKNFIYKF